MTRIRSIVGSAAFLALALGLGAAPAAAQQKEPPPAPAPLRPVEFPAFHERTLKNGARVIIVENHEQPVVSVNLRLRSGAKHDPAGKAGVASSTASLLDKGTATPSAAGVAEEDGFGGRRLSPGA